MSLMDYFRKEKKNAASASIAKERLQILVAHDRARASSPDYLPSLQKEILDVIRKYVAINEDEISVNLEESGTTSVLELNITLPDR